MGYTRFGGIILKDSKFVDFYSVQTITTAGPVTYTVSHLLGGLILRDPNGAARADVTPTGAEFWDALAGINPGAAFRFTIRNTADAAETITLTPATGVTLDGTMTIAQGSSREFLAVLTAQNAVTIYSLGAQVF